MSDQVKGNIKGLAPSELRRVEKLFTRKLGNDEIVSLDLAREIFTLGADLSRRVGVLVSREGRIEEVFLGAKNILYLPDLGRYRLGVGRLRKLRLIFSDLSNPEHPPTLPPDIYADLQKLRLDAVVGIKQHRNKMQMAYAYIVPSHTGEGLTETTERVDDIARFKFDFAKFISDLEDELAREIEAHPSSGKSRVVLVGVYEKKLGEAESSMAELKELARTAGVEVADTIMQRRDPDPKTVLGKGKLEEVVLRCLRLGAEMIIFDTELKPGQWRAITNSTELKVIDRSMLILDIFAQHAKSSDGRLQVELAQLKYNLPRLVEKDTGLSRLTGGIGGRGPGETKLEIGRRVIRDRIVELERRIDKLADQRHLRRSRRKENKLPLIAIVGYTNVGKSTLFNTLTQSTVLVEDKLFATLDPAQRKLALPGEAEHNGGMPHFAVISDTVGFIRQLPEELRSAFRATLEELREASLILHVLDASDPEIFKKKESVEEVLAQMELKNIPQVVVLNKIDQAKSERCEMLEHELDAVKVSALKREGLNDLLRVVGDKLFNEAQLANTHL